VTVEQGKIIIICGFVSAELSNPSLTGNSAQHLIVGHK
jgi:hypothetical protein